MGKGHFWVSQGKEEGKRTLVSGNGFARREQRLQEAVVGGEDFACHANDFGLFL